MRPRPRPAPRKRPASRMECLLSPRAAEPVGPYPHAVRAGNLLFLSGIGPRRRGSKDIPGVTLDPAGEPASYDFEVQCRAAFDNVRFILEDAGSGLDRVVDFTAFLTHLKSDFKLFNRVYAEYFPDPTRRPARTTVEVSRLPTPIAVEFKLVALAG